MKTTLTSLQTNIDSLIDYVNYNESVKQFLTQAKRSNTPLSPIANGINYGSTKFKAFEYNSYIISLYGFFENFIEGIAKAYLTNFDVIYSVYEDLPEQLQKANITKVTDLLGKLELPKYQELEANSIIKTLNDNLNNHLPSVCIEAFTYHGANFGPKTIGEYFKPIGLSNLKQDISLTEPMLTRLNNSFDNPAALDENSRFETVKNLAERRNHIAHGVETVDLLTPTAIVDWCMYLKDFCESLYLSVLSNQLDEIINIRSKIASPIELIDVYAKKILCFHSRHMEVMLGQEIIVAKNTYPKKALKTIDSIQLNNKDITRCPAYIDHPIGVNLGSGISKDDSFYLLHTKL